MAFIINNQKSNSHFNQTKAFIYKEYVIFIDKYASCWSWSSDFSYGSSSTEKEALRAAQLSVEQILTKKAQR